MWLPGSLCEITMLRADGHEEEQVILEGWLFLLWYLHIFSLNTIIFTFLLYPQILLLIIPASENLDFSVTLLAALTEVLEYLFYYWYTIIKSFSFKIVFSLYFQISKFDCKRDTLYIKLKFRHESPHWEYKYAIIVNHAERDFEPTSG